jgi:short-subunit dehydrogenase
MSIPEKTILVTGAAKGIGKAISQKLISEGAHLILVDIEKIDLQGSNIYIYQADLTKFEEIEALAKNIQKDHPRIDILINNAGIGIYKKIEELELSEWQKAINLNVTAPFFLTKLLLPNLLAATQGSGISEKRQEKLPTENLADKPLIINIGSGCGKKGVAGRVSYCSTKFALRGMSLSLYEELDPLIKVIYLALGSVATEFGSQSAEEKLKLAGKNYLTPKEVAQEIYTQIITNTNKDLPAEIELYPKGYYENLGKVF